MLCIWSNHAMVGVGMPDWNIILGKRHEKNNTKSIKYTRERTETADVLDLCRRDVNRMDQCLFLVYPVSAEDSRCY